MKNKNREFIELPFVAFIKECPDALELFPPEIRHTLMSDPDYLVRVSDDGYLEIGYKSDKWAIA